MKKRKLIAILRGIQPTEAVQVGRLLIQAGISSIEVPLNSPQPMRSIEKLLDQVGDSALIGAGSVLNQQQVNEVAACGAHYIVAPNCNRAVMDTAKKHSLQYYPGVFTASECFTAIEHGADGLKIFPASVLTPHGLRALRAVLPATTTVYAVGGIDIKNCTAWFSAGANGLGIGSTLYSPGRPHKEIQHAAETFVTQYDLTHE